MIKGFSSEPYLLLKERFSQNCILNKVCKYREVTSHGAASRREVIFRGVSWGMHDGMEPLEHPRGAARVD